MVNNLLKFWIYFCMFIKFELKEKKAGSIAILRCNYLLPLHTIETSQDLLWPKVSLEAVVLTGPKYLQFGKFEYFQEKSLEIHMAFWKQCF